MNGHLDLSFRRGRITTFVLALLMSATVAAMNIVAGTNDTPQPDATKITVVYDNYGVAPQLGMGWGYAAVIETGEHTVLFDTGADGPTLMGNLRSLGFDPQQIDAVVLSHAHGDHTLGLDSLLATGATPTVYVLPSFPAEFKNHVAESVDLIEVEPRQAIIEGVFTTGEIAGPVNEQALVVESGRGLVVITGCAHPGIAKIVTEAKRLGDADVHLVTGGFHLLQTPADQVAAIIAEFRRLGVEYAAPSHCTGDAAIGMFRDAFGDHFIESGVGRVFLITG
jgi:7,8-dihydropterin-6-yl-methyl-4-(beta-D-ribofuranosyl)aminobenzene 5'-phosphate synthase